MSGANGQAVRAMSCDEVGELAGLFVLGALEHDERVAVEAHFASCKEAHEEVRQLGGVVPSLAMSAEPIDAPADLKSKVMAAVGREAAAVRSDKAQERGLRSGRIIIPGPDAPRRVVDQPRTAWHLPAWASWASLAAALAIVAVVGVWALGAQNRATQAEQRAEVLADAIAAFSAPGSQVAILRDSTNPSASGFAALSADGSAYLVIAGMPEAPAGMAYQAWYIADGAPVSAGLITIGEDGLAVLADTNPMPGTQVVALTLEPAGGSLAPTSDPFVVGELRPAA